MAHEARRDATFAAFFFRLGRAFAANGLGRGLVFFGGQFLNAAQIGLGGLIAGGFRRGAHAFAFNRERLSGGSAAGLVFTPHLVPMTRGVLATLYCRGRATTEQCLDAARDFYAGRAFIRVTDKPPQTKWATGSNLAFVSYAADPERNLVIAMGVVDNLGKGAAGQAVQNANLICGLPETAGLEGAPVWP